MGRYAEAFQQSLPDPEGFWGAAVQGIDWYHQPTVMLDKSDPPFYRWFADGVLNTCFNAVDRRPANGRMFSRREASIGRRYVLTCARRREPGCYARTRSPFGSSRGSLETSPETHWPKMSTSTWVPNSTCAGR